MPQAPNYLQEEWDECSAIDAALEAFTLDRRFIFRKKPGIEPTEKQWRAVQYMILEWDYDYAPEKKDE